ncbi:MAG TPA: VOC family protein [Chryseosolibacter sp.]|nr:VOC family protein [Chryseosolibacter sp.]
MHIEHIAIWTKDIERLRTFYVKYFDARTGDKYVNPTKRFESYFLSFKSGARLELMQMPDIPESLNDVNSQWIGLIHFGVSVGSTQKVDLLTEQIRAAGYVIVGPPRTTGDGYYESVVLDPDGNRIEITV